MNRSPLPSVEVIQASPTLEQNSVIPWRRWKIFAVVLLIGLAIGLTIVYARSPIYRATASVLTVKPKAVDMQSAEADIEHVAIQQRLLLGEELLGHLASRWNLESGDNSTDATDLRGMLTVVPVTETNLLELRAEGDEPAMLQRLVNWWGESYEEYRLAEIDGATLRTTTELTEQQDQLALKIENHRKALLAFRETHDIVSLQRDENRSLARLKGLNNTLNKARAELIDARAHQQAIDESIARGEVVIPKEQKADITKLKLEVEGTRARVADLNDKFTERYIELDPELQDLPQILHDLEGDLARALELAQNTTRLDADQALQKSRVAVTNLEQELAQHQRNVQQFTQRFKEFSASEETLGRLENLFAENAERLAQIEVTNRKKFPPIEIVEWARLPDRPIYPDYERDLMIVLGTVLALALFLTWLFEYLSERSRASATSPNFGVRIYPAEQAHNLGASDVGQLKDPMSAVRTLPHGENNQHAAVPTAFAVLPRELAAAEIKTLLDAVDPMTANCSALLLCGISPGELGLLDSGCFDREHRQIDVPGSSARELDIEAAVWPQLDGLMVGMTDRTWAAAIAGLDLQLVNAARGVGLREPASVDALSLWHSYVVYLVRQGIDSTALIDRVGFIAPDIFNALMQSAPPGGSRPLETIDFAHPALA